MSKKEVIFSQEARDSMMRGVDILANAVKSTLGPKGRHVVIQKEYGAPHITKDGVSVAKEINLENKFEDMGAQMVKEVAQRTVDAAGDGTTTATCLAHSIITQGVKAVADGANPMDVKRGIDKATAVVIEALKRESHPVTDEDIVKIATISANSDEEMGRMVADAVKSVGKNGVITVEPHSGVDTIVDVVKGMQLDIGYLSPYFITNDEKGIVEFKNPFVLITDGNIDNLKQLQAVLEHSIKHSKEILIIADNIEQAAIAGLAFNKMRGAVKVCAIKPPAFGEYRKQLMEDIAALTGATIISEDAGINLENMTMDMLGSNIESIVVTKEKTSFVGSSVDKKVIEARAEMLQARIENTENEYEKERLKTRLSKLVGGVAVIKVGGSSELEVKEKKDRIDDAVAATKSAIEEGYVSGGGTALFFAGDSLKYVQDENTDRMIGVNIVRKATEAPLRTIAENAGENPDLIAKKYQEQQLKSNIQNPGFNAATGEFEDMVNSGIIDPLKVVRVALQNAASVAGLMITTEAMIGIIPSSSKQEEMM